MRGRNQILNSLERVYRDALDQASGDEGVAERARLDFEFQRDQVHLEILLDIREFLVPVQPVEATSEKVGGLLDTAQKLRNLTKLR